MLAVAQEFKAFAVSLQQSVIGTASWSCVRPIFTTLLNSTALASIAVMSASTHAVSRWLLRIIPSFSAEGYTSLVDCEQLTWFEVELRGRA